MALVRAMWPKYKKNKMSSEVSRASHTHQVPHIGLPHSAPVQSDKNAQIAPVGASARHIIPDSRVLSVSPNRAQNAMAR